MEDADSSLVPPSVFSNFGIPVFGVRFRPPEVSAIVAVPKATVHKDAPFPVLRANVGSSRYVAHMNAIAISEPPDKPPNDHFGSGVLASHGAHD